MIYLTRVCRAADPFGRVCIVTIVRLVLVVHINYADETYTWITFGMFTTLEFYLGIVTASLPLLPPVGKRVSELFVDSSLASILFRVRSSIRHLWPWESGRDDVSEHPIRSSWADRQEKV